YRVAGKPEGRTRHERDIFDQSNHADDRGGINVPAKCLIVKTNVAAGDRGAKEAADFRHSLDNFAELPHHLGMLGVAEIQTIRRCNGTPTGTNNIAARLGNGHLRALTRISRDAICRPIQSGGWCLLRAFNPDYSGVGTGPEYGVRLDHVIVLLPNPSPRADIGAGD